MGKKVAKYLLSMAQQKRAAHVLEVCNKAVAVDMSTREACAKDFKAEFATAKHLKEVAHFTAFGRALRPNGVTTYAYRLFREWSQVELFGRNKETGRPNVGVMPGRKSKRGAGSGVSPGKWGNALHEKMDSISRSVEQATKSGNIISVKLLGKFTAAVKAVCDLREAIDAEIAENKEAAEKAAA
jgi:hypothetical protein